VLPWSLPAPYCSGASHAVTHRSWSERSESSRCARTATVRAVGDGGTFAVRGGPQSADSRGARAAPVSVGKRTLVPQLSESAPALAGMARDTGAQLPSVGTSREGYGGHDVLELFGRPSHDPDPAASSAPSAHVDRGAPHTPASPTANVPGTADLATWVGAGKAGRNFRNATVETFVDPASTQSVEVNTGWTLAEYDQLEIGTNAVMEVDRRIHIRLNRGVVVAKSRVRAFFHADRLPNDVHAAVHAPARLIHHDGAIFATDHRGTHLLRSLDHSLLEQPSAAALLARELMLGFQTEPAQRIREADRFVAVTLPTYGQNMLLVETIMRDAPPVAVALQHYVRARLNYETPSPEALSRGRHQIARIHELLQCSWTGYEGTDLMVQLGQMRDGFQQLLATAEAAKPAEKHMLHHAADLVAAIGQAGVGLVLALKEVGLMARDLGLWGLDQLANVAGQDIDWRAASSVGKAYESGKSTGEILAAMVGGVIDSWQNAIEHAENGDYSKVMALGAELALDIALTAVTAGAATSGFTVTRVAEHALVLADDVAERLARRTQALVQRAEHALRRAPDEARAALLDTIDTVSGWLTGLRDSVRVAHAGAGTVRVIDKTAITTAIQRSRGLRALDSAKAAMNQLRGGTARAQGASVIEQLQRLANVSKMPDAIYAVARRIAAGQDKARFVGALDRLLKGTAKALDDEVVSGVLRRAADAVDPIGFLDNVESVMRRKGLTANARKALVRQAVLRESPLDLRWLRELTDLPSYMLEYMALDPATPWRTFMKVSRKPSDYFPSSLKKSLKYSDYADAGAKLRGVAGELTFVVEGIELPGGLKVVARQVDAGGRVIDFGLRDASGARALLEVKAWTAKRWVNELASAEVKKPKEAFKRLTKQLKAANAIGPVYLAVSDSIGTQISALERVLSQAGLRRVHVVTFSEARLKEISRTLRKGLGLAVATVMTSADQLTDGEYDD
jgi:hypothetical protein